MKWPKAPNAPAAVAVLLLAALAACTRGHVHEEPPIHPVPNMDVQPRAIAQGPSDFFADGKAMRSKLAGTVAREDVIDDGGLASGVDAAGEYLAAAPIPLGPAALRRGEERYGIFCAPCHGDRGDGQGVLTARAGVQVTSLHDPRLVEVPDGQLVETITRGLGLMPGYAAQIPPADRWAIVRYVRQLQAEGGPPEETSP